MMIVPLQTFRGITKDEQAQADTPMRDTLA
jgi:hypothetical protein